MDARLQDNNEMQEEELYALLDKAWETDRLCVSEELIQKTLKRVAEEDTKVISFEKAAKRKLSPVKYVSVAAAAVFVLVIGMSTLGRSGLMNDKAQMEATYDKVGRTTESTADGVAPGKSEMAPAEWQYSSTSDSVNGMLADAAEAEDAGTRGSESVLRGGTVALSERMTEILTDAGMAPMSKDAECWEFVYREESWEDELLHCLEAAQVFEEGLPEDGAYSYVLGCKDGSRETIHSQGPLDLIVCIRTDRGTLWGLYGETVRFCMK